MYNEIKLQKALEDIIINITKVNYDCGI